MKTWYLYICKDCNEEFYMSWKSNFVGRLETKPYCPNCGKDHTERTEGDVTL